MHASQKKTVVVVGFFFVLVCLTLTSPELFISKNLETNIIQEATEDLQIEEDIIIEGEPVFVTSSAGDDYVDTLYNDIYGSEVNGPPSGMAQDSTTNTDLTEVPFSSPEWSNLMTQSDFSSGLPSGWSDDGISYSGGNFRNDQVQADGYIACSSISTVGYQSVRFTFYGYYDEISSNSGSAVVEFFDSSSNWDLMGYIPVDSNPQDHIFSSTDSQYQHSGFKIRVRYLSFQTLENFLSGTNWRIDAQNVVSGHRLRMVYQFSGVDYATFITEQLYVDFDSASSEYLDFLFESGDSTPDFVVANHVNNDFNVNIHSYLTGSNCYVEIRDEYQVGDEDADTWSIDRMYIRLTNSEPIIDNSPECTNLDDGDNLYARRIAYDFATSVSDADGYAHIDYVELSSLDSSAMTLRWTVRFDEDTNTFSEITGQSYIELSMSSWYVKSGESLDVHFRIYIEWDHPDTTDDTLYLYVRDGEGAHDDYLYLVNYDYETRIDIGSSIIDDGSGTPNRGDVGDTATASGTVTYLGSTINPPTNEVDVWVSASGLHSGAGPWSNSTLINGVFTITIYSDDTVGFDFYYYKIVPEGSGFDGDNQLAYAEGDSYISDQIYVQSYYSNDNRINVNETSSCGVYLRYAYDDTPVTDGTIDVNILSATYAGTSGEWTFGETSDSVTSIGYNSVSASSNTHGITVVDQNGKQLIQIWDQIIVERYASPDNRTNIGETIGAQVFLNYDFDDSPVTTGTITVNGIDASYVSDNIWSFPSVEYTPTSNTFSLVEVSGDTYGISSINQNSKELTIIWDSVSITITNPSDQRINIGENATGIFVSGTYDFDSQPFAGLFVMNNSEYTFASVGRRAYTVSMLTGDTYGITAISSNDETYCIWDAIEIYQVDSPDWVLVDETFKISCKARLMYDGHVLGELDNISIDGEVAAWNGTHYYISRSYGITGDRVFSYSSGNESTYGITYLGNSPEVLIHVTTLLGITEVESGFTVNDGLYTGVYLGPPLWIHWDPLNDPLHPNFTFRVEGAYITSWNVTSSWSGLDIESGTTTGTFLCEIEDGLPYSATNHTYTIWVGSEEGKSFSVDVFVLVHDYVVPNINSPSDVNFNEGSTGVNILWIGSDLHPATYQVFQDEVEIAFGLWNSSSESIIIVLDGLDPGEYVFEITLNDTNGNSVSDVVTVTVVSITTTTSTTSTTTTTTSTTGTTTTATDDGTILTISIVITISGIAIVIVIIILRKR